MSTRELIIVLKSLPPAAQQEVADLVAFLKGQQDLASRTSERDAVDPMQQPFIGMWRDREDMKDAAAWVRKLRQSEWRGT